MSAGPLTVEGGGEAIRIGGDLTIETASRALDMARDVFRSGQGVLQFDLGGLQDSDSAALSVLLEWQRQAARHGRQLTYRNVPDRLLQLAEISELENVLGFNAVR